MHSTLTASGIRKDYREGSRINHVLHGVDLTFNQGKSYAISGVSGSGKSTLLHIISGFERPTQGKILFNDKDIFALSDSKKASFLNQRLGFVFQFHYLINELTVLENIMLVGRIGGLGDKETEKRSKELLDFLGLSKYALRYSYQLSGGEQQRVSIARALFNKPDFVLADEPTGNLDADNAKNVVELFLHCQREWGLGLIICSHDKHVCESMDEEFVLEDGVLAKSCKTE